MSVSAVDTGDPARALHFRDLLPVEEDQDRAEFPEKSGISSMGQTILPAGGTQDYPLLDEPFLHAGGTRNILINQQSEVRR